MKDILNKLNEVLNAHPSVGIFSSGGFDSTLLCYLVFKTIQDRGLNIDLRIYTVPRHDNSVSHSERVISRISEKFPLVKYSTEVIGNPDLEHSQQVFSGIIEAILTTDRAILSGSTAVPEELRDGREPRRPGSFNSKLIHVFMNYDKRMSVLLANTLGVLNFVSELSHTCTESVSLRCGRCWQCGERAWAFNSLGYKDIGTM